MGNLMQPISLTQTRVCNTREIFGEQLLLHVTALSLQNILSTHLFLEIISNVLNTSLTLP